MAIGLSDPVLVGIDMSFNGVETPCYRYSPSSVSRFVADDKPF